MPKIIIDGEEWNNILDALDDKRIFDIEVNGNTAIFTEGCDDCFSLELTKAQVLMLADELVVVANSMTAD